MSGIQKKSFDSTDDVRPFADGKGQMKVVDLDGKAVGLATFEPGWRWSEHVKPIAGTDSCQAHHTGYVMTGQMTVRSSDGTEATFGPGDLMDVQPGHDAWVIGDEACTVVDWLGSAVYAKPAPR